MTGVEILAAVSAVATVASTAISIAGAMSAGSAQAQASSYNAQVATQDAAAARQQAQQNAIIQQQQARQKLGGIAAAYGASGVTSEGSALDVLASSAANSELDRQTLIYHGELQASGYSDQAALDAARIGAAKTSALTSSVGLLLNGGAKALTEAQPLLKSSGTTVNPVGDLSNGGSLIV